MWFIYALLSAILASLRKVNDKHLSHNVHHLHLAWMTKFATLPIVGILAALTGQILPGDQLPAIFWVCFLVSILITTPIDTAVYLRSLKYGKLSETAPFHALYPGVMLISGAVFLMQIPKLLSVLSVLIIVAGVFVLTSKRGSYNVFHNIWRDRGKKYALVGVFTVSVNSTFGAIMVHNSAPLFVAFWGALGSACVQFMYAQKVARGQYRHPHIKLIFKNGLIQGVANALYFNAVATGPIGYVTAIRSLSSTFSSILGARAFNEGMGRRKIIALCMIAIGAALLGITSRT